MRINIFSTGEKACTEKREVRKLIRKALAGERKSFKTVNVILADDQYLRRLNTIYFKKKKSTNVISFGLGQVAEIYVSDKYMKDTYELLYYILHGLLHTIGYDHISKKDETLMDEKCREYLGDE